MLESIVRETYFDYIIENNLEDNDETIEMFLAFMYYEIRDNLEDLYEEFSIPKDLEGIDAQNYVENIIKKIIKEAL